MKKSTFILYSCLIFLLLLFSCSEDDSNNGGDQGGDDSPNIEIFSENFGDPLLANFFGKVVDVNNNPLENVNIDIGGISIVTNQNGLFNITEANVFENFALIKARKEGYVKGSKVIVPQIEEFNYTEIVLLEFNSIDTVNSGEISEVSLDEGAKVVLNGSYVNENGSIYSGGVQVSAHYLSPTNEESFKTMPGSLLGSLENNEAVILETYGMIAVDLISTNGESLNISDGTTATIEIPIEPSQLAFAPETIPLWYFDDDLGYWIQEGEASKINNKYVGEVSHFTFWGYCIYDDGVNVCINVKDSNGVVIPYQHFKIAKLSNGAYIEETFTALNGSFCDYVPYNEPLLFSTVFTNCDGSETLYEQEIGAFISNGSEVNITLNIIEFVSSNITATILDCESQTPIENGYYYFDYNGEAYNYPIGDSVFQFNFLFCVEQPQITLVVYNLDTNTETTTIELNLVAGENNLGVLNTCDDSGNGDEDNNIYQGNVTLGSQQQVEDFGLMAYTKITGDLIIDDDFPEVITNLNALQDLIVVEGDLRIFNNGSLTSLFGLQNLERVEGNLVFTNNDEVDDFLGIQSLHTIGGNLAIANSSSLQNCDGLQNVSMIPGDLDIANNSAMENLEGLNNLIEIQGSFSLGSSQNYTALTAENIMLSDISALSNLAQVGGFIRMSGQPVLEDYSGLNSLQSVNGDFTINFEGQNAYEIDGFQSLTSVSGTLSIWSLKVTDFSGFNNLLSADKIALNGDFNDSNALVSISGFNSCDNTNVEIRTFNNLTSITGFQSIVTSNRINISQNNTLQSITGFNSLESDTIIFALSSNPMLSDISGFSNITNLNTLLLSVCPAIISLDAFNGLTTIDGYARIYGMDGLSDFTGMESLQTIQGRLEIEENANITSLEGLNNLTTVNFFLRIGDNDSLLNLNGLEGLTYIDDYLNVYNNQSLQSLDGLESLLDCDGLRIGVYYNISSFVSRPNPNLSDLCALQNLLINGDTTGSNEIIIENNAYNPSIYDIQNGNCSL